MRSTDSIMGEISTEAAEMGLEEREQTRRWREQQRCEALRDFLCELVSEGGPLASGYVNDEETGRLVERNYQWRQRTLALLGDPDGAPVDGFFWRDGERWLRERGREFRLLDLAPHLEADWRRRHPAELAKHTDPDCERARKAQEGRT